MNVPELQVPDAIDPETMWVFEMGRAVGRAEAGIALANDARRNGYEDFADAIDTETVAYAAAMAEVLRG